MNVIIVFKRKKTAEEALLVKMCRKAGEQFSSALGS